MGLDSYFYLKPKAGDDKAVPLTDERLGNIALCGGMFSGQGSDGSFRGKVYDPFLSHITNEAFSLYVEDQSPDDYHKVIYSIEQWLIWNPEGGFTDHYEITREEIEDLKLLFTIAHHHGAHLHGWW